MRKSKVSVHALLSVHPERSAAESKGENKSSLPFDKLRASGAWERGRLQSKVVVVFLALLISTTSFANVAEPAARQIVQDLVDGKYDAVFATFNEGMKKFLPIAKLRELMEPQRQTQGPAKSIDLDSARPAAGHFAYLVRWSRGHDGYSVELFFCGDKVCGTLSHLVDPVDEPIARRVAQDLVDGKYAAVIARFDENMKKFLPREAIASVCDPMRNAQGPAVLVNLNDIAQGEYRFHIGWTHGPKAEASVEVHDGKVAGLKLSPAAPDQLTKYDHFQNKTKLRPPFHGTWTAHNADRDEKNHHFALAIQRFAVDWVMIGENGKMFRTDGSTNADYYGYGQDALAPATGKVVMVVDGIPDNQLPTETENRVFVAGNHVVIDLGQKEFALFMHLIPGSIRVKVGDRVQPGQVIGKIGNSGNSSAPHLHFQLSDGPYIWRDPSIPAQFSDVLENGKRVPRSWPVTETKLAPVESK